MSNAAIEARRLSGVDIGKTVSFESAWGMEQGRLLYIEHDDEATTLDVSVDGDRHDWTFAPTDVVTLTGTTPSEEGS